MTIVAYFDIHLLFLLYTCECECVCVCLFVQCSFCRFHIVPYHNCLVCVCVCVHSFDFSVAHIRELTNKNKTWFALSLSCICFHPVPDALTKLNVHKCDVARCVYCMSIQIRNKQKPPPSPPTECILWKCHDIFFAVVVAGVCVCQI